MAFLTTNTASASAMLTWLFLDMALKNKPSALGACVGAVVGLVAITPAAGFVDVSASMIIGVVAGIVSNLACRARAKSAIDTLDVFSVTAFGVTGMILTAVLQRRWTYIRHTYTFLAPCCSRYVSLFVFIELTYYFF
jgi:Amt family ammonium transporter